MVDKAFSIDFLQIAQFGFEVVLFEQRVGESHADTTFRESRGMDMYGFEFIAYWRKDVAVTLEFDDDKLACSMVIACLKIMEADIEVDGEAFRLSLVNECHAIKLIAHYRPKPVKVESCLALHKFVSTIRISETVL